ncbi:hypothetical protein MRX96_001568 [Rhipicephalus microplus]
MKFIGRRTVSAKREASETADNGGQWGLPKKTGKARLIWGHRQNITGQTREWYKYMVPPLPLDKSDWLEDRVWESEASETTCHEGQRGLEKLGEAGICVAPVTALLTRHRVRHKYIIPLPLLDEIDVQEDRVCKSEASETGGHRGHRGLPKNTGQTRQIWGRHPNIAGHTPRVVQVHCPNYATR